MRVRHLTISSWLGLSLLAVTGLTLAQDTQEGPPVRHDATPAQCSGKASDCKKPAKFLSKEGECICYTCEVGTENQKAVCTTNTNEAKLLVEKERETEQENRDRNAYHPPPPQ